MPKAPSTTLLLRIHAMPLKLFAIDSMTLEPNLGSVMVRDLIHYR